MMGYIEGQHRSQITLFPESIDQYIAEDSAVRVIDAFIDGLDLMDLGFDKAQPKATGRPPYDPRDLLKLYVYGYLNRVRSTRLLEREAQRNVEVMWLVKRLRPDFKTIADFRKDNGAAIRRVSREFIMLCRRLDLLGGELVAIDGSPFKAVNSRDRNYTEAKLKHQLKQLDSKIARYLQALDAHDSDEEDDPPPPAGKVKAALAVLKEKRGQLQGLLERLGHTHAKQVSLSDPDARYLSRRRSGRGLVGYNVQTAVDAKHKLIAAFDVVNAVTDKAQLVPMTRRAQRALGREGFTVVADAGYYHGAQIKACEQLGAIPYVPSVSTSPNRHRGLYDKGQFHYDAKRDAYRCPAGETLRHRYTVSLRGQQTKLYETGACAQCASRSQCTWRKRGNRRIGRWVDEQVLEAMAQRVAAHPEKLKQRRSIVEHPFGTIKRSMDQGYFLMKRLVNVRTEMSLTVLAYNLKRVINILGPERFLAAMA